MDATTLPADEARLLHTVPEAARMLSVSTRTIYALFESGAFRSVLVGKGSRRVRHADLLAYIEKLAA